MLMIEKAKKTSTVVTHNNLLYLYYKNKFLNWTICIIYTIAMRMMMLCATCKNVGVGFVPSVQYTVRRESSSFIHSFIHNSAVLCATVSQNERTNERSSLLLIKFIVSTIQKFLRIQEYYTLSRQNFLCQQANGTQHGQSSNDEFHLQRCCCCCCRCRYCRRLTTFSFVIVSLSS